MLKILPETSGARAQSGKDFYGHTVNPQKAGI